MNNDVQADGLRPCPFFDDAEHGHKLRIRDNGRDGCGPADSFWVQCKCGAEGPNARDATEAVAFWNRRPTELETQVKALTVRRGGVVVVKVAEKLPEPHIIGRIRSYVGLFLPEGVQVLVIDSDTDVDLLGPLPFKPTHRHYKGGLYEFLCNGFLEADMSVMAIYRNEHGNVFVRPQKEWLSQIDGKPRFEKIDQEAKS